MGKGTSLAPAAIAIRGEPRLCMGGPGPQGGSRLTNRTPIVPATGRTVTRVGGGLGAYHWQPTTDQPDISLNVSNDNRSIRPGERPDLTRSAA